MDVETITGRSLGTIRWSDGVAATTEGFQLPVGTVTLLLADVEGSTRHWERAPSEMTAAVADLSGIVDDEVGRHGGVRPEEQGEGDSFVAAFARAADAATCAVALQRRLRAQKWPEGAELRLRVGLHTGDVQLRDGRNYIGTTVNRAARVRDLAHGGQIVMSHATHELVADSLPEAASTRDLGVHRLRDLSRPERIHELHHPDLRTRFPPLRSLDRVPNNLPTSLTSFVGRARELADVRAELARTRLLTLTGSGGAGKTRLALQLAGAAADGFGDGAWFVDLSSSRSTDDLDRLVTAALGLGEHPADAIRESIVAFVTSRSLLLVLDNCEQLVGAVAELVALVLERSPGVVVLATSREPLGVPGEVTWRVPSLSVPPLEDPVALESIGTSDAVALFIERAHAVRPNFAVTADNAGAIARICQRLDGIPLAIELAASRVRVLPAADIAAALDDRFRLLGVGPRTALPRQATLRASLDWSYDLLTDTEQTLFARLGIFVEGFTLDAAERVCADDGIPARSVLDLLDSLAQKSLVAVDPDAARYRLLETMRHYALDRLDDQGERELLSDRHLAYFAERLRWPEGGPNSRWRLEIRTEDGNVAAALDRAVSGGEVEAGLRLAAAVVLGWAVSGRLADGNRWLDELLAKASEVPASVRARALWARGWLATFAGDAMTQVTRSAEALPLAKDAGDAEAIALSAGTLAHARSYSDTDGALPLAREAAALLPEIRNRFVRAHVLFQIGNVHMNESVDRAIECFEEALGYSADGAHNLSTLKGGLATALLMRGEVDRAVDLATEALDAAKREGFHFWQQQCLATIGMVHAVRGETEAAATALREAVAVAERLNVPSLAAKLYLGWADTFAGDGRQGLLIARELLGALRALGLWPWVLYTDALAVEAAHLLGDGEALDHHLAMLEEDTVHAGRHWGSAVAMWARARAMRGRDDLERADDDAHAGLAVACGTGAELYTMLLLGEVATVAFELGSLEEAGRLFGGLDRHLRASGIQYVAATGWRRLVEPGRAQLGGERWEQLWQDGTALSLGELVAYAQRGRGERGRPPTGWASLTPVELRVAGFVKQGLPNKEIGERLFISANTVRTHMSHIFRKLGLKSRAELAAAATRRGL